jgi:ABC-2 type transport system ATP-binding protein
MLTLSDLHFRYKGAPSPALSGVSFNVDRGEIVGLLGPNGAGKTTLISHLAGLLPLQQGSIFLDESSLADSRKKMPSRIAIAPQEYAFYPTLTVSENLQCFGSIQSTQALQQRIDRALVFSQLEDFRNQQAQKLSGGLKRRLNLAIATLSDPEYLLLDEPTAGVDPQTRAFLLDSVRQLADTGVGIIYTSHYMEEVEALADKVVILDHGRILQQGSLNTLLAQGQPLLKFSQTGLDDKTLQQLLSPYGTLKLPDQILLHPESTPSQILSRLEQAGAEITYAEFGRFNLGQLFMQLTHRSLRD